MRYAACFRQVAPQGDAERDGFALERKRAGLLAGQAWAEEAGRWEMALNCAYAALAGLHVRGLHLLQSTLRAAKRLEKRNAAGPLDSPGLVYGGLGNLPQAREYVPQAVALFDAMGMPRKVEQTGHSLARLGAGGARGRGGSPSEYLRARTCFSIKAI